MEDSGCTYELQSKNVWENTVRRRKHNTKDLAMKGQLLIVVSATCESHKFVCYSESWLFFPELLYKRAIRVDAVKLRVDPKFLMVSPTIQ